MSGTTSEMAELFGDNKDTIYRVEYYDDWEPGKLFQFHYEPVDGWTPRKQPSRSCYRRCYV